MTIDQSTTERVEQLREQDDVRRALREATAAEQPLPARSTRRPWLSFELALGALVVVAAVELSLRWGLLPLSDRVTAILHRLALCGLALILVLTVAQGIERFMIGRISDMGTRYNLLRVLDLLAVAAAAYALVSLLFVDWYATAASLGIASLVIGLALQSTLQSFFGWVQITVRRPFRVGDRIKIGDATGDVIHIGYFDTTLWEFGGRNLTTDHPSGRIITIPNSKVLDEMIYNYSWPLFPYLWNEIRIDVAYNADLDFVTRTMQQAAEEEIGEQMLERVRTYKALLAETPIDHLAVSERPNVVLRPRDNTWIEVVLRYVVHPKETGRVRTAVLRKILERLNSEPERSMLPKDNMR